MRRFSGFSLMEMMIVLAIVAIIAAASAPMMNKKMVRSLDEGQSWWKQVANTQSIAYNFSNDGGGINSNTANIGGLVPNGANPPRLFIESNGSNPHISFRNGDNTYRLRFDNKGMSLTDSNSAIGESSVGIGHAASSAAQYTIAIGNDVTSTQQGSIAMGDGAQATGRQSIAIGSATRATAQRSVAIGFKAEATRMNQITLGNNEDTVYIPGDLIVQGKLIVKDEFVPIKLVGTSLSGGLYKGTTSSKAVQVKTDSNKSSAAVSLITSYGLSDRRLKNVGNAFKSGLAEIKKLEVFNYTFKDDKDKTPRVGVMAQDLKKIFPNAVIKGEDGFLRIRMEDMFYALVNAVKELDSRVSVIEKQQKRIDELEKRIEALEQSK